MLIWHQIHYKNEEIALHFGRFGRIVNIKNSVGNENRIIRLLLDWKRKGVLVRAPSKDMTLSCQSYHLILSTTTVSKGLEAPPSETEAG